MNTELLDDLFRINDLLRRDMARAFAGTPLTESRVAVLWTLRMAGPSTQRDVATALEVSAKNVSLLVDALEASGHVRRAPHPTDRRAVMLELTESSDALLATMEREHAELAATLVGTIPDAERAVVARGVAAIAATLRRLVDEAAGEEEGS